MMLQYAFRRVLLAVPTLLGLSLVLFVMLRALMPTDAVDLILSSLQIRDPELEDRLRETFGLDRSLPAQYGAWISGVISGDFGESFYSGRSVVSELRYRLPVSIELGLGAMLITLGVAVPIGVFSAVRQDTIVDYATRGPAILIDVVPSFWVATLIIVFGSILFGWAPQLHYRSFMESPLENIKILWLPMLLLGLNPAGSTVRLVRTQVLEVLRADHVRTARAKGLGTFHLYTRHVLRNALIPVVTVVGLRIPSILAGTVILETIFGIPGVGRYLVEAVSRLDYNVILSTNLLFGTILVTSNIVVDLSYGFLDPRVRYN